MPTTEEKTLYASAPCREKVRYQKLRKKVHLPEFRQINFFPALDEVSK